MKNKKIFLKALEERLNEINYKDVDNIIEYYDELIEDKKESNKSEEKIIEEIASIDDIVKNIKVEMTIDDAEENPTIAKSSKALLSVLGVLSLPLLIPVIAVIFAISVTAVALFISLIAVMFAFIVSSVAMIIVVITGIVSLSLPLSTAVILLGVALILFVLSLEMFKILMNATKIFCLYLIKSLKKIVKGRNKNE